MDGLAAGSAGLAGGVVEVRDGYGSDANTRAMEADCSGDSSLFGADGEPVGGVFDVAAGYDSTVCEEERGAHAEVAVGGVGVVGGGDGALVQVFDLCVGEAGGGHDVSEAIGCERGWQVVWR